MSTAQKVTLAALVGLGSFCVYSLMKQKCCSNNNNNDEDDQNALTKGSTFTPNDILEFWYGKISKKYDAIDGVQMKKWFRGGKAFDDEIRDKFGEFMKHVLEDKQYDDWRSTPKGTLALIIVADQFTRNVYRNTADMFKYDSYALQLCLDAIDRKLDVKLLDMHPAYAQFCYMPLMHSEQLEHHQLAMEKYSFIMSNLDKNHPHYMPLTYALKAGKEHMQVIEECGRYPQRNHLLGRTTTEKEKEVIKKYNLMELISQSESS